MITSWFGPGFTIGRGVPLSRHCPGGGCVVHCPFGAPGVPKSVVAPDVW
ncbi:MAG TPA: hypothetical protein VN253_02225 [Kofleriaceae bacterium]|nr:hypothetical protein [Kofleriaceae bacterium]